jgi:hypothetical protein
MANDRTAIQESKGTRTKRGNKGAKRGAPKPERSGPDRKAAYSLAGIAVFLVATFGDFAFKSLFGMEFMEAAKKTLVDNAPLTLAFAVLSVRIYKSRIDEDGLPKEILIAALTLSVAGWLSELLSGHAIFSEAFRASAESSAKYNIIGRALSTGIYVIGGYIHFYGVKEFLLTLVTGAALPWVALRKLKDFAEKAEEAARPKG